MAYQFYKNPSPAPELIEQAKRVDTSPIAHLPELLESYYSKCVPEQISVKHNVNDKGRSQEYIALGNSKIAEGKVALLIMAGGAATRLGADCPKGAFDIGGTCLFRILLNNAKRAGEPDIVILLSVATAITEQLFKQNNYYDYQKEKISFVFQDEYPVVNENGEILCLEDEIEESPNGNGGFLNALKDFPLSKYDYLHIIGVDNAFVRPIDAEEVGFAYSNDFNIVNRVLIPKQNEKVGICGFRKNSAEWQCSIADIKEMLPEVCPTVFEYSEIDWSKLNADEQYGSIANHLFKCSYLNDILRLEEEKMAVVVPYHLAHKKVAYYDFKEEKTVMPDCPNAWKFEHFIFDYFHFCTPDRFGLFVCDRDEFVPLKEKSDIDGILERLLKK